MVIAELWINLRAGTCGVTTNQTTILLLQGPLGPFFADLSDALKQAGAVTHRVCFNRGDHHFAHADYVVKFDQPQAEWPNWLEAYVREHKIDAVCCYGDCRSYHMQAKAVCAHEGVAFIALEEGYVRPGFVTLELGGNNANSPFPAKFKAGETVDADMLKPAQIANHFRFQFWFAFLYYVVKDWRLTGFRQYQHHRTGNGFLEMLAWLRGFMRKQFVTRWREAKLLDRLIEHHSGKIFLVPLQVAADMQIICHSDYANVREFIGETIQSFAEKAPMDAQLVIKHHPMDRGFQHYGGYIGAVCREHGCADRVTYAFDLDLETLFEHAAGCVTVNSTVGLQALGQGVPSIMMGQSMAHAAGIAPATNLNAFWAEPNAVDRNSVAKFRRQLIVETQVPGSYYRDRHIAAQGCAQKILQINSGFAKGERKQVSFSMLEFHN